MKWDIWQFFHSFKTYWDLNIFNFQVFFFFFGYHSKRFKDFLWKLDTVQKWFVKIRHSLWYIYRYRDFICLNQILINWLYTSPSTMLIKEYETPEEAKKKQLKFMKLVFFAHTKEWEDVSKKRVCDTHGTHESTMQSSHFVCIKPTWGPDQVPDKTIIIIIIIHPESFGNGGNSLSPLLLRAMKPKIWLHHPTHPKCREEFVQKLFTYIN